MTKKIFTTMSIVLVLCFSLSVNAFAMESLSEGTQGPWQVTADSDGNTILVNTESGEKMLKAYRPDENGNMIDVDLVEYATVLNTAQRIPSPTDRSSEIGNITPISLPVYDYREVETYIGLGDPVKVTADVVGPADISIVSSSLVSHTFGGEVSVTGTIKDSIELGASFDWHTTLESGTELGYSFPVDPGVKAYVQFTPYLNVTKGDLYFLYIYPGVVKEFYEGEVWGATPIKLSNGFADGTYELIEKP